MVTVGFTAPLIFNTLLTVPCGPAIASKENFSFLLICHDLALVQAFCDRVLVLYHGETVESGTPDEIINHPKMDYTKKLIDSVL